jgi:transposase-like protein
MAPLYSISKIERRRSMEKRKHPKAEITTKLAQANDLAAQGKPQSEIARALGVSVITLHRWRKLPSRSNGSSGMDQAPQTPRKFTAAAFGDRSAPRKDEHRRGIASRACDDGWTSHEASSQSRLAPFWLRHCPCFTFPAYHLPAARLRLLATFVQRRHARMIASAL